MPYKYITHTQISAYQSNYSPFKICKTKYEVIKHDLEYLCTEYIPANIEDYYVFLQNLKSPDNQKLLQNLFDLLTLAEQLAQEEAPKEEKASQDFDYEILDPF